MNVLGVCHCVWGGLILLFSSVLLLYVVLGVQILHDPASMGFRPAPAAGGAAHSASAVGSRLVGGGSALICLGWVVGLLNLFSGRALSRRRGRSFSLIVAALDCALLPLGMVLGVFTFVVLGRASVRRLYERRPM